MSGEGGPSVQSNDRYRNPNSPEQHLRDQLKQEVYSVLEHTEDPLAYEICNKILEKLAIKDEIDQILIGKDDITWYQQKKQLGIFWVIDRQARITYIDKEHGIEIHEGDSILDIHLPSTMTEDEKQNPFPHIERSMRMIADYIVRQDLHPKYVMGVTYERLARVSRRQGFKVIEPEVPDDIRRGVERVYQRFGDTGLNEQAMGRISLCVQETGHFLERYFK